MSSSVPSYETAIWSFYRYEPSKILAIIAIALFSATTLAHVVQTCRHRNWYFSVFIVGCLFEVVGYIGRLLSAVESPNWTMGPYIIQAILILLGPALFAASIYMTLGRIIDAIHAGPLSLISPRRLTRVFVSGDVVSFLLQAAGGGIQAGGTLELLKAGDNIIMAGLAIQLAYFGFFIATIAVLHVRLQRSTLFRDGAIRRECLVQLGTLYLSSLLILIRSIFRLVEYAQGNRGFLISHEAYLYIFDTLLMLLVTVLFLLFPSYRVQKLGQLLFAAGINGQYVQLDLLDMNVELTAAATGK